MTLERNSAELGEWFSVSGEATVAIAFRLDIQKQFVLKKLLEIIR